MPEPLTMVKRITLYEKLLRQGVAISVVDNDSSCDQRRSLIKPLLRSTAENKSLPRRLVWEIVIFVAEHEHKPRFFDFFQGVSH